MSAADDILRDVGIEVVETAGQSKVADVCAQLHAHRLMYVPRQGGWHVYDGTRWTTGDGTGEGVARQAVMDAARRIIREAADIAHKQTREAYLALGHRTLSSATHVNGVLQFLSHHGDVMVGIGQLDADPTLFNVGNGTLDLVTGTLRRHDPRDRITKVAGTEYHADAVPERWLRFVTEALGDELADAAARLYGGPGMDGRVREHLLPITHGPGGAGKGTFRDAIKGTFGDYAIEAEPELILARREAHKTGEMDLRGVRLAFVSENDEGRKMAVGTMKRLTGGDPIRARGMHKDFTEFQPSHLLTLVTNHLPVMSTKADDRAVWRRVRVLPFTRVPEVVDLDLKTTLAGEAPGILAWLMRGRERYAAQSSRMIWPTSVTEATDAYKNDSDIIAAFIEDCTEADDAGQVSTGQLYNTWKSWLKDYDKNRRPGRTQTFVKDLTDAGIEVVETSDKRARTAVRGLRLKDDQGVLS